MAHIVGEYPQHDTLYTAVSLAYERTLKPFHNIVVKGVVSVSIILIYSYSYSSVYVYHVFTACQFDA